MFKSSKKDIGFGNEKSAVYCEARLSKRAAKTGSFQDK